MVSPKIEGEGRPKYSVIGWGDATKGQLGTGIGKSKEQMILIDQSDLPANIIEKYRDMKAGVDHALFLTTDGEVYGWGGSSDSENIYKVHKIEFNGNPKIIYIAVGNGKSAALDENGNI